MSIYGEITKAEVTKPHKSSKDFIRKTFFKFFSKPLTTNKKYLKFDQADSKPEKSIQEKFVPKNHTIQNIPVPNSPNQQNHKKITTMIHNK